MSVSGWQGPRFIVPAVVLIAALYLLPAQLAPRRFPSDDSFFYLQVARNIAAGNGSTFNSVTPTNGYHPLWMGPCVLAEAIARGDRDLALRIVFAIQAGLAVGALLLFRSAARSMGIRSWILSIPLLAAFFLTGLYGSEAHLNGFFLLSSLLRLIRYAEAPGKRNALLLGLCLGLCFLARLDNVFFVAATLAVAAWSAGSTTRARARALPWIAAPILAAALPYLAWNLASFGHLVPISGAVKSTFPVARPDLRNLGTLGLVTLAGALIGGPQLALPGVSRLRRLALWPLAAGVAAHAAYIVLYTDHNTHWSWYYVAGVVLLAFLAPIAADALAARWPRLPWRAAVGVVVVVLTAWGILRGWARFLNPEAASHNQLVVQLLPPTAYDRWSVQFARWMDRNLPERSGVLVFDYPGALAYYSSLRILPADGLMSDFRFDEELRRRGLAGYLAAKEIAYYLGPIPATPAAQDGCDSALVRAPLSRVPVGMIVRCPGDRIVTSAEATRGVQQPDVALYRIRRIAPPPAGAPRDKIVKRGALW
jgi:hypothetical protein